MSQLESALVIALRDTLAWESAIDETTPGIKVSEQGTLHPVTSSGSFVPEDFQLRDRQLGYRDLITAAAIVEASVQVSDVWNFAAPRPLMQGPAQSQLTAVVQSQMTGEGAMGQVRHVAPTWIPYDAARYTDLDLYGRDGLAYEILARACAQVFPQPPIARIDLNGTVFQDTSIWPLGSGTYAPVDISGALPLDTRLFGRPDRNLADRDNQLAGYVARVAQVLKNPFAYAQRLYVRTTGSTDVRESEVYILTAEDSGTRTWQVEPALSHRNRIIYDKFSKTLTWARERSGELHVPQLYALSVPGIEMGQLLETVPSVPERKDVQFWRAKAARVIPSGGSLSDSVVLPFTALNTVTGGQPQISSASFTVPGAISIALPLPVAAGRNRIAVLAIPNPVVEIAGVQNISNTLGTEGGATYLINVQSGNIKNETYYVEGGAGIVYNGNTYAPGQTFTGVLTATVNPSPPPDTLPLGTYAQVSASYPSQVRQYLVNYQVALPPGDWAMQIEYTNLSGFASGFGIEARYKPSGSAEVVIIKDTPQFFTGENGDLVLTHEGQFSPDGAPFVLSVLWTYGTGELHIRRLIFRNLSVPTCRISMGGTLNVGAGNVEVMAKAYQPETLLFDVVNNAEGPSPAAVVKFSMSGNMGSDPLLPVQLKQVVIQTMGTYNATPDSGDFQGWRQECLDRCERTLQQAYGEIVHAYGTNFPVLYDSGTGWDWRNSEAWMALLETKQPRLREVVNVLSGSLAFGHQYKVISGSVIYFWAEYTVGQTFYAFVEGGRNYSGPAQVNQVGAFRKSNAGHIGKPCLLPYGLEFAGSLATLAYSGTLASPAIVSCQPWMIDRGLYTAQEDFWMPVSL